ncbi:polysaccharide biosynthesis protein [Phytohabitans sp. ZYX-F-186]|uniref:UDP-glucose 4-epimerase n=1 Tax=Phytohabitans maris TaxID=3071409 RepID=A0ABU0ZME8_9ACTN|nr:polysaccharide biosynthesis protein [Phytohabitans sp. ZYX-F-186]MDQ7908219.1 polysaccharide biosynthesis protein [Phytohabitans sp. ZYX-F-186]
MTLVLADRNFLITGGTGSFGQTMVARLLAAGAAQVRVFSRDEAKQEAMRLRLRDDRLRFHVGDVRDPDSVARATRGVDYVFHAAALKQVPSCEFFPLEAIRTNALGSANVVEASERAGVAAVVLLSTDKAVYPVNAMGMTKALMEKVAHAHARAEGTSTVVSCVRYGNVMYSRGSVIPLFVEQVRASRPLTVTDPRMTRFMMSLDDSVRLVEHAFLHARPGDLFVRKASACTVGDLATAVSEIFDAPAKLDLLGVRHGEKLYETLVSREEMARAEDRGDYFRIPLDARDLNYALYVDEGQARVDGVHDYTSDNAHRLGVPEVRSLLLTLPEIRAELAAAAASS